MAGDLLRQGSHVFAECVNPLTITREAWRDVAATTGARLVEVELVCSDPAEHERRATTRTVDIPDLALPTWRDIVAREYDPWDREHVVLDTAGTPPEDTAAALWTALECGNTQTGGVGKDDLSQGDSARSRGDLCEIPSHRSPGDGES